MPWYVMVLYSKNYSKFWSLLQAHVVYHKPTISEKCNSFQFIFRTCCNLFFWWGLGTASVKINLHNLFFSFSNFQLCWCWKLWIISTIIFCYNINFPNEGICLHHHLLLPFFREIICLFKIWLLRKNLQKNATRHRWSPVNPMGKNCHNFSWRFDCHDNNVDCCLCCFSNMCII